MTIDTSIAADPNLAAPTAQDREAALARWRAENDASGFDEAVLTEASRVARVVLTSDGPAFDPTLFRDLVEFVEELPF